MWPVQWGHMNFMLNAFFKGILSKILSTHDISEHFRIPVCWKTIFKFHKKFQKVLKRHSLDLCFYVSLIPLQWRHNGHYGISNHQPHHCLLNPLFRRKWKKTSKLRITGLCAGNSPMTGEFPTQMGSNAENVSIRWRHHVLRMPCTWFVCALLHCHYALSFIIITHIV